MSDEIKVETSASPVEDTLLFGLLPKGLPNVGYPAEPKWQIDAIEPPVLPYKHGWMLDTHKRVFSALLSEFNQNKPLKVIVEMGSWYGASCEWYCDKY